MFWESVWLGFSLLTRWQVWVGVFAYSVVTALAVAIAGYFSNSKNSNISTFTPLVLIGVGSFFEALVLSGCIVAWLPLLLPGLNISAFPSVLGNPLLVVRVSIVSAVAVLILGILPLVGRLLQNPLVGKFVQALIIFRLVTPDCINTLTYRNGQPVSVYPGFWSVIGYAIIGLAISFLFAIIAGSISPVERENSNNQSQRPRIENMTGLGYVLTNGTLTALGSVLPLFMYSQYVKLIST